jgi:hypothetical protein
MSYFSPKSPFLSEPLDSTHSVRFSKSNCFELLTSFSGKGLGNISRIGKSVRFSKNQLHVTFVRFASSRFWPFQVGQPSAILILPALVNRMPPKTSSMYPSSISRALCSDGMRCIKPLAPSRNETNSSRVNGGAVGAIVGICSYGGRDQAEFVATIKLVQSPVLRAWHFGKSADRA